MLYLQEVTLTGLFCLIFEKESNIKREHLLPGRNFWPFMVKPFLEGYGVQEHKLELQKLFFVKYGRLAIKRFSFPLKDKLLPRLYGCTGMKATPMKAFLQI